MKFVPCTKTVKLIDSGPTGAKARALRITAGISLRDMAKRMNFTPAYVSDLECGKRNWSKSLVEKYERALNRHA